MNKQTTRIQMKEGGGAKYYSCLKPSPVISRNFAGPTNQFQPVSGRTLLCRGLNTTHTSETTWNPIGGGTSRKILGSPYVFCVELYVHSLSSAGINLICRLYSRLSYRPNLQYRQALFCINTKIQHQTTRMSVRRNLCCLDTSSEMCVGIR